METKLTNGLMEAVNILLQLAKRIALAHSHPLVTLHALRRLLASLGGQGIGRERLPILQSLARHDLPQSRQGQTPAPLRS